MIIICIWKTEAITGLQKGKFRNGDDPDFIKAENPETIACNTFQHLQYMVLILHHMFLHLQYTDQPLQYIILILHHMFLHLQYIILILHHMFLHLQYMVLILHHMFLLRLPILLILQHLESGKSNRKNQIHR